MNEVIATEKCDDIDPEEEHHQITAAAAAVNIIHSPPILTDVIHQEAQHNNTNINNNIDYYGSIFVKKFSFNQDGSCFIAATTRGFRVYTSSPLSEFVRRESDVPNAPWDGGPVLVASMLYRSSCFALVSEKEPRVARIWNDVQSSVVGDIYSKYVIRNVLLGRDVIIVVTDIAVYIYRSGSVTPLSVIVTGPNAEGVCAIADCDGTTSSWCIACPGSTCGSVRFQLTQGADSKVPVFIEGHKNPLSQICLSRCGTWMATTSTLGTIVRVFRCYDGERLFEFRAGTVNQKVTGVSFRGDKKFLAVCSNANRVDVFKLWGSGDGDKSNNADDDDDDNEEHEEAGSAYWGHSSSGVPEAARRRAVSSLSESSHDDHGSVCSHSSRVDNSTSVIGSSAIVSAGKEWIHQHIKTMLPKYFTPSRSFAHLNLPIDSLDIREPSDRDTHSSPRFSIISDILPPGSPFVPLRQEKTSGPACMFAGDSSNHLLIVNDDGFFYEARFDGQSGGACRILSKLPWFAPRPDFSVETASLDDNLGGLLPEADSPPPQSTGLLLKSPVIRPPNCDGLDEGVEPLPSGYDDDDAEWNIY